MKIITKIGVVLVLCGLSFWLGRFSLSRQVFVYAASPKGYAEAFPRNRPVYGLDLSQYAMLLSEFRSDNSSQALSQMEVILDDTVQRAKHRLPLLSGWSREQLYKALGRAARYREKYPRPLSKGTRFYWTADRQREIDMFLSGFTNSIE